MSLNAVARPMAHDPKSTTRRIGSTAATAGRPCRSSATSSSRLWRREKTLTELDDLLGMSHHPFGLAARVQRRGRSGRVRVRIACRDVRLVQLPREVEQLGPDRAGAGDLFEEIGDRMPPRLDALALEHGRRRLLGGLLR